MMQIVKKAHAEDSIQVYNRKEFLDSSSCSFFENLDKKFERTITYHSDPLIPKNQQ